jgi:hypothetical protein
MNHEHNPVKLEKAPRHNLPPRWKQISEKFSNAESALTYLKMNPELLGTAHVFRIVDSDDTVVMDDLKIRDQVRRT